MTTEASYTPGRGRPLWAIGGLLLAWVAVRATILDLTFGSPFATSLKGEIGLPGAARSLQDTSAQSAMPVASPADAAELPSSMALLPYPAGEPEVSPAIVLQRASGPTIAPLWPSGPPATSSGTVAEASSPPVDFPESVRLLGPPQDSSSPGVKAILPRWSGDAWLLWREGAAPGIGTAVPVYGASQAGAILRFAIAPASSLRPAAYVRVVQALAGQEGDFASGLSLTPLAGAPLTVHAEARVSRRGNRAEIRPAGFMSAGTDELVLPASFGGRGYVQIGYVGGRDSTPFADGHMTIDRPIGSGTHSQARFGVGAWGGAQRGSARLDVGPTASLRFRLGPGNARLAADYRFRVAGNGQPADGAALTLSAGF